MINSRFSFALMGKSCALALALLPGTGSAVSHSESIAAGKDIRIIPLVDSRLTGNPWYVLSEPSVSAAVEIVTLEDSTGPRLEQKRLKNDGVSYLVGHDVVALACDYRGAVYNAGS